MEPYAIGTQTVVFGRRGETAEAAVPTAPVVLAGAAMGFPSVATATPSAGAAASPLVGAAAGMLYWVVAGWLLARYLPTRSGDEARGGVVPLGRGSARASERAAEVRVDYSLAIGIFQNLGRTANHKLGHIDLKGISIIIP